jgi:hypothetical protein
LKSVVSIPWSTASSEHARLKSSYASESAKSALGPVAKSRKQVRHARFQRRHYWRRYRLDAMMQHGTRPGVACNGRARPLRITNYTC